MSRSISLLGNAVWIVLTVATLLYPCLPARDPNGEVFALSRFDFSLLYLANPEALWLQWTAGLPLNFWTVRSESIGIAVTWLVAFLFFGSLLVGSEKKLACPAGTRRLAQWASWLVLGYSLFLGSTYIQLMVRNIASLTITALCTAMISLTAYALRLRLRGQNQTAPKSLDESRDLPAADRSLDQPWKRRLFGLATISCALLAALHIVGSMTPSVDIQVRKQKWVQSTRLYEHNNAPNSALTQITATKAESVGERISHFDFIAFHSMQILQIDVHENADPKGDSTQSSGVATVYAPFMASKLVHVIIGIAGFLMLWGRANQLSGRAPSMLMLLLLLATPATTELARLGRVEWIATTHLAAIVSVLSQRARPLGLTDWLTASLIAVPTIEWFLSMGWQPTNLTNLESDRVGTLLRFIGLSPLFTIPWFGCLLVGSIAKPTISHLRLLGLGATGFMLVGVLFNQPDRSWIPALSLLALPVANGISWLFEHQSRFFGLPAWCVAIVISLSNAAYWPLMENRILAPVDWLVQENWLEYGQTQEIARSRFPYEFRKQLNEGKLPLNAIVLLLGTQDDLDVPVECVTFEPTQVVDVEQIESWIIRSQATHIGLVSNGEASELHPPPLDRDQENATRRHLQRMVEQGKLAKLPVSAECFDLTLYHVNE